MSLDQFNLPEALPQVRDLVFVQDRVQPDSTADQWHVTKACGEHVDTGLQGPPALVGRHPGPAPGPGGHLDGRLLGVVGH